MCRKAIDGDNDESCEEDSKRSRSVSIFSLIFVLGLTRSYNFIVFRLPVLSILDSRVKIV